MVIVIIMIASYTNVSHRHHDIRCGNRGQQQEQEQGYCYVGWTLDVFSYPEQLNRWPCLSLGLSGTTNNQTLQSDPRDLRPLRHLIRVMKRHDLTKKFFLPTYLPVHLPQSTPSRCDSRDLWPLWHLFRVMRWPDLTKKNFAMLWHLRHWLQYRQSRTWIHDNLCYLTINCDTGQHSQFLQCFLLHPCLPWSN